MNDLVVTVKEKQPMVVLSCTNRAPPKQLIIKGNITKKKKIMVQLWWGNSSNQEGKHLHGEWLIVKH